MLSFWIVTAGAVLATAFLLVYAVFRGRRAVAPAEAFDMQVYRDQLAEIERDAARGTIAPEEADRLRTEVARRLLAADQKAASHGAAVPGARNPAIAISVLMGAFLLGGAYFLYGTLGAPGYGDLPRALRIEAAEDARQNRPSQEIAEASVPASQPTAEVSEDYLALVQRLRGAVAERNGDLQGYTLLARSEAALGNFAAAYAAQEEIIALKGDAATAKDYADLADMMVLAAGGYVSPEAEQVLEAALTRDPENGVARYYLGLVFAQTGRPDRAFRVWDALLRDSAASDPWFDPLLAQIDGMAQRAGVTDYAPPQAAEAPLPGPDADTIARAGDMSAEDRAAMIEGMVSRLGARLAEQGGSAEEWARLVGALAVLGRAEEAMEIYAEAQQVFAGDPAALDTLRDAASGAGIGQ